MVGDGVKVSLPHAVICDRVKGGYWPHESRLFCYRPAWVWRLFVGIFEAESWVNGSGILCVLFSA